MLTTTPGRVSQNLPIPKCSTCNQFVPLEELGEHICTPSKLPTTPAIPKSLQGRIPSTGPAGPIPSTSRPAQRAGPNLSQSGPTVSRGSKLPVNGPNSPTKATFQPTSSVGSQPTNAGPSRDTPLSNNSLLTRLPQGDNLRQHVRVPSNASVTSLTVRPIIPTVARSTANFNQNTPTQSPGLPPRNMTATPTPGPLGQPSSFPGQGMAPIRNDFASNRGGPPPGFRGPPPPLGPSLSRTGTPVNMPPSGNMIPPRNLGSPAPQKIVDSSGTIAPGVVVPVADFSPQHFVPPPERGIDTKSGGEAGMAGVGRRGFAAVARAAMFALPPGRPLGPQAPRKVRPDYLNLDAVPHPTETPPLSAGSGYSSHSPGPTSPLPQSEFPSQPVATKITRTPSPFDQSLSTPTQSVSLKPATQSATSPLSVRFPFFEKFKNKLPANSPTSDSNNTANNNPSMSSLNSSTPAPTSVVRKNTSDSSDSSMLYRSVTSSTNSSRQVKDVRRPISPIDSESEYGGLAYADSTDYEDNDGQLSRSQSKSDSHPEMPALILRAGSNASSRRHHHPSASEHSDGRSGILIGSTRPRPGHSRDASASSISSAGGGSLTRANSFVIAQALGLSQTPPSDYGKLGGPGVMGVGGRLRSESSSSRKNVGPENMEKALEDVKINTRTKKPSFGSSSQRSNLYRADTIASTASSRKIDDVNIIGSSVGGSKSHRSNTIQNPLPHSPEAKQVKLPMRSLTSPKVERDKTLDGNGVKARVRKAKVCLKCQQVIDNGRWVSVDGGGVLCEKCWKNMYLPKCRRCNLSIEKQAVSSSDGQLKGKYHKECFNCDTCHKPFPDKTFYVYDGKPLCAYHYHEANDSLCAAAMCGQPIEGPCAVSHSGDRYHPEHMTCEHPGYPPCKQMLSEYWEMDGRMLCERHAHSASVCGSDDEDDERSRSKKRVTQFIDLAGGIGGFGGGDSGLR